MAAKAFNYEYRYGAGIDSKMIKCYLYHSYKESEHVYIQLNNIDNIIQFYRKQQDDHLLDSNTTIINHYMQFVYSTFEYKILPIVNIGLDIHSQNKEWIFGNNVLESLQEVSDRYNKKIFSKLNVDELTESQIKILDTLKDYGLNTFLKKVTLEILQELDSSLNVRYSTYDIIRLLKKFANSASPNNEIYQEIVKNYLS